MNTEEEKSLNFNFDHRSITVGASIGSSFVSGQVGGDVVSSIK
ncbi:MAG: hypothetical protein SWX82_20900 [Cyanobacteriota bacterium]|nr:hypothetical protein [Cyanobacteriota bacterium]